MRPIEDHSAIIRTAFGILLRNTIITFCCVVFICLFFSGSVKILGYLPVFLAALVFSQGIFQIGYYYLLAQGELNRLNFFRTTQAAGLSIGQMISPHYYSLYIAEIVSRSIIYFSGLNLRLSQGEKRYRLHASSSDYKTISKSIVGSFCSGVSSAIPLYYFSQIASISGVGYSLIEKMFHVPLLLVSTFLGQYFFSRWKNYREDSIRDVERIVILTLIVAVALIIMGIYFGNWRLNLPIFGFINIKQEIVILLPAFLFESLVVLLLQIELALEDRGQYILYEVGRLILYSLCAGFAYLIDMPILFSVMYLIFNIMICSGLFWRRKSE